jgi:hypothetical protein
MTSSFEGHQLFVFSVSRILSSLILIANVFITSSAWTDALGKPSSQNLEFRLAQQDQADLLEATDDSLNQARDPLRVTVPDVVGFDFASARNVLQRAGFLVFGQIIDTTESKQNGKVISQDPAPGTVAFRGSKATLTWYRYRPPIPDIIGSLVDSARHYLESLGFTMRVGGTVDVPDVKPTARPGTIGSQDPAPGTTAEKGTAVTVTVYRLVPTVPDIIPKPEPESSDENIPAPTPPSPGIKWDLTGTWVSGRAIITQSGDQLTVSMPGRGTFKGSFIGADTIKVDFTDDPGCCSAKVVGGDTLSWSNGSTWIKERGGNSGPGPMNYPDLTGTWVGGKAIISQNGKQLTVRMPGRNTFHGKFTSAYTIRVDFFDAGYNCCNGKVVSPSRINWDNGTTWLKK